MKEMACERICDFVKSHTAKLMAQHSELEEEIDRLHEEVEGLKKLLASNTNRSSTRTVPASAATLYPLARAANNLIEESDTYEDDNEDCK